MKSIKAALLALLLGSSVFASAQGTQTEMTLEKNQTVTGKKIFTKGAALGPVTFANLGTLGSPDPGTVAVISDGSPGTVCAGGGTGVVAVYLGGTWNCSAGGGSANFASPPPLGNVTPNTVAASTVTVNGSGLFFQPQSNCIFEGSDPTLHELEDVSGKLMWLYQGLGGPCTQILNYTPLPDGVNPTDKQVPAWNAASGQFTIQNQTTSSAIDVRDAGVDCTGVLDSGAALNTLFANISGRQVTFPDVCSIKTTIQLVIQSQSQFVLHGNGHKVGTGGFVGPIIYGCNAAASGPVLYINRSGYGRIEGIGITTRGPSGCSTSTFTGSVQVDSTGNPGVTTHDLIFENDGFTTSAQGGSTPANYIGLSITDGGKQNGEMIRVRNTWIHCQNSTGSIGIDLENPTSDKDVFESNNIENCYIGIKHNNGNATIKDNLLSSLGDFSVFGSNGAAIWIGSCSSGPINILNNEADSSGQFINTANDAGGGLGCTGGVNVIGNDIGISDYDTANVYPINLGTTAAAYIVEGNQINFTQTPAGTAVGSKSQGSFGPQGSIFLKANTMQNAKGAAFGFCCQTPGFQNGQYELGFPNIHNTNPIISNTLDVLNYGTQVSGFPSPFSMYRSSAGAGGINDDWAIENVTGNTPANTSSLIIAHIKGQTGTAFAAIDGKFSGLTLSAITAPAAPAIQQFGAAGSTSYTYAVCAITASGQVCSVTQNTLLGNATLNGTNFNQIQTPGTSGALKYCFYRTASAGLPASTGLIGCIPAAAFPIAKLGYSANYFGTSAGYLFNDTGLAGDSSTLPVGNTTGVLDASLSPYIFLPLSAGYVATAQGNIGYDTTAKNWHVWQNAADRLMAVINGAVTNNDCAKFVVSGSIVSLQDAGACAGGTTTNPLTVNNSNSGAASGTTFDGSVSRTISTNTIGAPNLATANTFSTGLQDMSAADYLQPKHTSDPGTCTEGQIEENTTSHLMKFCSATNTWTSLSTGTTTNALTVNNGNSGAASGSTFNGSSAVTISTNSIGAPNLGTANTFGAFLQDFSASTIKLPVAAGFTTTANGNMGYDSTNLNWHVWQNGADRIAGVINGSTTNGDCSKFVVSGSTVSLQDSGAGCGPVSVSQLWLPGGTPNELPISPTTQTGQGTNTVGCIQFVPTSGITATKMSVSVNTVSAAQTFNVGIYDNSLNLVRDSGSFACGSGGGVALTNTVSSFTLTPGSTYYACVAFTDATCAIQGLGPTAGYANIANKNATRNFTCANALSAGAMPASCGVQSPVTGKQYIILLEQ